MVRARSPPDEKSAVQYKIPTFKTSYSPCYRLRISNDTISDRRVDFSDDYSFGAERALPVLSSGVQQRDPYEQLQCLVPYNYWTPYGPGS